MKNQKISVEEVKDLDTKLTKDYSALFGKFKEDEDYYELKFKGKLGVPREFANEAVVLPTARDIVDTFVDHINIKNAKVYVNRMSESSIDREREEMMRKFYIGLLYATNTNADLSPWRAGAKYYAMHGLAVFKTVYEADLWPDKPEQKDGEGDEEYEERLKEWNNDIGERIPILIQAVHPGCVMKDPSFGHSSFVIEKHSKICLDARKRWPQWSNPMGKRAEDDVDLLSYWDNTHRCDLVDGEPILRTRGGVAAHNYGFIPYVFIDSGLGNTSYDNDLSMRYVGILRYMFPLLVSESANYSMCNILMKRETMKGGYITGSDADTLDEIKQDYGKYWPVGDKDVQFHDWETKLAPAEAYAHLALTHDYISGHGAPPSVRGLSQAGVRSAAHYTQIRTEALSLYQYSEDAFKYGTQQVLINCAKLQKYIVPTGMRLWSKTMADNFDSMNVVVDKDKMKEPFVCNVEFSPVNAEDEFRRHIDVNSLWDRGQGIISEEFAWSRMPNVDPKAMRKEKTKERIRNDPNYQAIFAQYAAQKAQEAIANIAQTEAAVNQPAGAPPGQPMGAPMGAPPGQPSMQGHFMPAGNQPMTGASQLQRAYEQSRIAPVAPGRQGQGGGGNRP